MARATERLKQAMEVCELGALTLPNQVDVLMDAARVILQEAPTLTPPNEWVSVEERLPERLKDVIALYGNGRIDIDWVDGSGDFKFGSLFDGVTHWMPLPAPPTKEE